MELIKPNEALIAAIQGGLPMVPRPFAEIGERLGICEAEVIEGIRALLASGIIKRFGVVVRHHAVGYRSNAMCVWDVPDEQVRSIGQKVAAIDYVTLCYRRPRRLPDWPYNLFCMIHGRNRQTVTDQARRLISSCGMQPFPHAMLFSRRCFKQRGACYTDAGNPASTHRIKQTVGLG